MKLFRMRQKPISIITTNFRQLIQGKKHLNSIYLLFLIFTFFLYSQSYAGNGAGRPLFIPAELANELKEVKSQQQQEEEEEELKANSEDIRGPEFARDAETPVKNASQSILLDENTPRSKWLPVTHFNSGTELYQYSAIAPSSVERKMGDRLHIHRLNSDPRYGLYGALISAPAEGEYVFCKKTKDSECTSDQTISQPDGRFAFVTDLDGEIVVPYEQHSLSRPYRYKRDHNHGSHTKLGNAKDVLYAGEIVLKNGKLKSWNNQSGTYRCKPQHAVQAGLPMKLFLAYEENFEEILGAFSDQESL